MLLCYYSLEGGKYDSSFDGFFSRGSGGSWEWQTSKSIIGNSAETIEWGQGSEYDLSLMRQYSFCRG